MEIWKDIKGYEGKYQISNLGRVKSLERFIKPTSSNQSYKTCRERILRTSVGSHGYSHVSLEGRKHCIHKLLANAFLDNPENYNCVNHIDGDKLNNSLKNLEWCSFKYNSNHMFNNDLRKDNVKIKATILIDNTVMIFRSKSKAREYLKIPEKLFNKGLKNGEIRGIKLEKIE